jgi:mRNA interferase MazF
MKKDFDRWNERKKTLHKSKFMDFVNERDVWWCSVGVNIGVETDGKHQNFERPVLVLRKFSAEGVLVVPLTLHVQKGNRYHVVGLHDGKEFSAVISQVRLVSTKRLLRFVYRMDQVVFDLIVSTTVGMITDRPPAYAGGLGGRNVH